MRLLLSRRNVVKAGAAAVTTVTLRGSGLHAVMTRIDGSSPAVAVPVITSASAGATTATVRWSAPSSGAVTGYRVSRDGVDSSGTGAWSGDVGASVRAKTFTRLVPGSTYDLGVAAVTASGVGPVVTTRVLIAPAKPQGVPGNWTVSASGAALSAVAGPLTAPLVLEVDADLGDSAVWLTDPDTTPPGAAQTVVPGRAHTAGRHVYGLYWTAAALQIYRDGVAIAAVPITLKAESKVLTVLGPPIEVYRASVFVPV